MLCVVPQDELSVFHSQITVMVFDPVYLNKPFILVAEQNTLWKGWFVILNRGSPG